MNGNNIQEGNYEVGYTTPDKKVPLSVLPRHLYGDERAKITWPNREQSKNVIHVANPHCSNLNYSLWFSIASSPH